MTKVKTLRIPLSTAVMMRIIKRRVNGPPTVAETINIIKNIDDPAKIANSLTEEEIDELLCAHYYAEEYHAATMTSTRENITHEDVREAAAKVREIVIFLMENSRKGDSE